MSCYLVNFLLIFSSHNSLTELDGKEIMKRSYGIAPLLHDFLLRNDFKAVWEKLKKNSRSGHDLLRHFHVWFDAFRTMKLIRYLSHSGYDSMDMYTAIKVLIERCGRSQVKLPAISQDSLKSRCSLLKRMRDLF